MCDIGSIAATTGGDFTTGQLISQGAGVLGQVGAFQESSDLEEQREQRAGQILQATKQTIELKAIEQGRARGRKAAAIGRSGVATTGSAAKFLEQQDRLDEMALEAAKQRGVLEIGGEFRAAEAQEVAGQAALGKAFAQGADFGKNVFEGFDLG